MTSPGEIWLIDFGDPYPSEPAFERPALVVGPAPVFGDRFPFAFVVPLTTTRRGINMHVEIEPDTGNGLDCISYAQAEALRSVATSRLRVRIGAVAHTTHSEVRAVIARLLAFDARS